MLQNLNTAIITEVQIIKILPKPSKWVAAQNCSRNTHTLYLCLHEEPSGFMFLS